MHTFIYIWPTLRTVDLTMEYLLTSSSTAIKLASHLYYLWCWMQIFAWSNCLHLYPTSFDYHIVTVHKLTKYLTHLDDNFGFKKTATPKKCYVTNNYAYEVSMLLREPLVSICFAVNGLSNKCALTVRWHIWENWRKNNQPRTCCRNEIGFNECIRTSDKCKIRRPRPRVSRNAEKTSMKFYHNKQVPLRFVSLLSVKTVVKKM